MAGARGRAVLCGMQGVSTGSGTLAAYRLDHDYGFFGPLPRGGAGMKRTDYFRRRQNPHKDPGLNALRETRTAKKFKGGSDPGVSGSSAATNPLRSSRHFGVAPALG